MMCTSRNLLLGAEQEEEEERVRRNSESEGEEGENGMMRARQQEQPPGADLALGLSWEAGRRRPTPAGMVLSRRGPPPKQTLSVSTGTGHYLNWNACTVAAGASAAEIC